MAQSDSKPGVDLYGGKQIDLDLVERMIGKGNTGVVELLPCGTRVRKAPVPWYSDRMMETQRKQIRQEIDIYHLLPQDHPRLVRMLDYRREKDERSDNGEDVSITLEYMPNGSLLRYLTGGAKFAVSSTADLTAEEQERAAAIPLRQRASWALEATDGIVLLHAHDIIHADIRPENMAVDGLLHVRLIDFSGSALPGKPALSLESASFFLPRKWLRRDQEHAYNNGRLCDVVSDLFALGSSLYQIVTGSAPWQGLPHSEIEERFRRGEFPDVATSGADGQQQPLLFADTIRRCWQTEFSSASQVLEALKAEVQEAFGREDLAFIEKQSGICFTEKVK